MSIEYIKTLGAYDVKQWRDSMTELRAAVDRILSVVPTGSSVWYVDYPVYTNIGDLLIMLGTERFFEQNDIQVLARYSMHDFPSTPTPPSNCIIVLQGGGNFGDLYEATERFREHVIKSCPRNRVVVLPQTVYFRQRSSACRMRAVLRQHSDVHIFVRDRRSLAILRDLLGEVHLDIAPDMSHYLWPDLASTSYAEEKPPLYLLRTDAEQSTASAILRTQQRSSLDWPDLVSDRERRGIRCFVQMQRLSSLTRVGLGRTANIWRRRAEELVQRAVALYEDHSIVVTSRLHGHLLACLMGHPNVLLDNSYAKNRAYYDAWTSRLPLVSFSATDGRLSPTARTTARRVEQSKQQDARLSVAICTRNRADDLIRCVRSVTTAANGLRGVEVLVVDDGELPSEVLEELTRIAEAANCGFRYIRKPPEDRGLYLSRLAAVRQARGEFILFVDDDVEVFPDYIATLLGRWSSVDEAIVGIGGIDVLLKRPSPRRRLIRRLFDLGSSSSGRLSAAGYPPPLWTWATANKRFESEFLSGCNMSFRRWALLSLEPVMWLKGYSLGEDLLISWIARQSGKLLVDPALRVFHRRSSVSREALEGLAASRVVNHWRLLNVYKSSRWRYLALVWNTLGLSLRATVRGRWEELRGIVKGYSALRKANEWRVLLPNWFQ